MNRDGFDSLRPFPATDWSLVGHAGRVARAAGRREALRVLLERYLPAMRAHLLLQMRLDPDRAADLLQGFVSDRVIEANLVAGADRCRGKFRTFLLTALRRHVIDRAREEAARKRAPAGGAVVSLDEATESAPGGAAAPDPFDVAWAREVVAESVRRMRAECERAGRGDLWELFRARVLDPALGGAEPVDYEQLVARFGFRSPSQAFNALVTAKRMFVRVLRGVVGEYAGGGQTADEEIVELRAVLARAGAAGGPLPRL
jgi:DNA-directed RNA polymerase specialized sigma24 family protein